MAYPRPEIDRLLPDNITVDTLSDAFIIIFKQAPDFFNPETGTREMVNVCNFNTFIVLELNKLKDYLVQHKHRQPIDVPFAKRVISASMHKLPSDWIPTF